MVTVRDWICKQDSYRFVRIARDEGLEGVKAAR